jgi:DHA1 family bicyclomycin/chloramphenicol resistance-like MFS transporter
MRRLRPHSVAFTLLLGALATLASFATDMGLPVLAQTAASLGVTAGRAALTLSVFMAGFALGPLAFGPLSDHYGRRPLLLAGCAAFAGCGALAAFAASLPALLAWRFLMGGGAGACQVLVVATVRDLFAGPEARVRQSYVNLAAGLAPILAPTLGVLVAGLGGWRAIYGALAGGGCVLLAAAALGLGESAPRLAGATLSVGEVARRYVRVLRHPVSVGYVGVVALNFGCLFAYVSGSSLVLIELLHVTQRAYGVWFACTAACLMTGALVNARLSRRGVPHGRLMAWGLAAITASALVLLLLTAMGVPRAEFLVPLACVGFLGQGVVRPNAVQGAVEPMPEIAGVASAVLSGVQMLAGALASAAVAALFDGRSALAMTGPMAVCAVAATAVYFGVVRRAERLTARRASGADDHRREDRMTA